MNAAAASLNLTPGAISQRVRNLEERLDVRLFRRSHRRIDLTSEGSELLDSLSPAFRQIEDAVAGVAGRRGERPLAINTVSSFAASWLTPRLGKFYDKHPDISLEIQVDCGLVDFAREPVDFAIRHGLGDYPGVEARWLFAPEMIVVASPGLLADGPSIGAPADCLAHRRLQDGDRADWGAVVPGARRRCAGCGTGTVLHGRTSPDPRRGGRAGARPGARHLCPGRTVQGNHRQGAGRVLADPVCLLSRRQARDVRNKPGHCVLDLDCLGGDKRSGPQMSPSSRRAMRMRGSVS